MPFIANTISNHKWNAYKVEHNARMLSEIPFSEHQTIELVSLLSLVGLVLVLFVFTSFYGLLYMRTDNTTVKEQLEEDLAEEHIFEYETTIWNDIRGNSRSHKAVNCYNVNSKNIGMSTSEPSSGYECDRDVGFSTSDDDGIEGEELPLACVVYEKNPPKNVTLEPDSPKYRTNNILK